LTVPTARVLTVAISKGGANYVGGNGGKKYKESENEDIMKEASTSPLIKM
jgi:hypothetical protein